ncbi:MAG: polysaccharide deacetylase family protein [Oscillospiraceae bacterium]|nr:polysaccharide deacetylase family protein [Oscillospiraceae bacterium]
MKRKFITALILIPLIAVAAFVAFGNGDILENLTAVETPQPEIDVIVELEPEPPAEKNPPEEPIIEIDDASDEIPNEYAESDVLETENDDNDDDSEELLPDESEALPLPEINYPMWQTVRSGIDPYRPMIALTFDDGPSIHTIPILDALEFHGGLATFFVLGTLLESHRDIAQRIHMQGNEIANHTWSHQRLTDLSESDMHFEIYNASVAIAEITGFAPASLRPTYGAHNEAVMRVAENLNLPLVLWSLDTRDWYTRDADMIFDAVMDNVQDRDIIIMHDIREPTAEAAMRLIPALIEQGFQLVTVSELFYHSGVTPTPGRIYNFGGGRR